MGLHFAGRCSIPRPLTTPVTEYLGGWEVNLLVGCARESSNIFTHGSACSQPNLFSRLAYNLSKPRRRSSEAYLHSNPCPAAILLIQLPRRSYGISRSIERLNEMCTYVHTILYRVSYFGCEESHQHRAINKCHKRSLSHKHLAHVFSATVRHSSALLHPFPSLTHPVDSWAPKRSDEIFVAHRCRRQGSTKAGSVQERRGGGSASRGVTEGALFVELGLT